MANAPSILNDVLGPIMRGPSSSHTAAAQRIGRLARDLVGGRIDAEHPCKVVVEYDQRGSLASTHASQGSDVGLAAGLLGLEVESPELVDALKLAPSRGLEIAFEIADLGDAHPNTYHLTLAPEERSPCKMTALSTGGGAIEVVEIDGVACSLRGDRHETWTVDGRAAPLPPVMPMLANPNASLPFVSFDELTAYCRSNGVSLGRAGLAYEAARGGVSEDVAGEHLRRIARAMRKSVETGLAGTHYADRILAYNSSEILRAAEDGRIAPDGLVNRMIAYTTAVMEAKSAWEVVVAAPTAGSCGVVPGALLAAADAWGRDEGQLARALAAAGIVGVIIASEATFAAEVAGCQAECGAAGAMAAAGLVELWGGTPTAVLDAASIALQNFLGLICDPIANRVEAPCLGRNVAAAVGAFASSQMAMAGMPSLVPLDETARTMLDVGRRLPRELRCTALGGLSITPSAKRIERRLSSCDGCDGCNRCG